MLRGALGTSFRRIACVPSCTDAHSCQADCPYARIFEPASHGAGPSGLANRPRPFVFRAAHLDGRTINPGASFCFDVNLFDVRDAVSLTYFIRAFAQLAQEGLGPRRARVELTEVWQLNDCREPAARLYDGASIAVSSKAPLVIDLAPARFPSITRLRIRFVTPTELKSAEQLATHPEFAILASRIRDRLSTLSELYGSGPLPIDFQAFGERAALIRMTECNVRQVSLERRSSRTGQTHSIGGFTGEAEYEGDLAEFIPYLEAAHWTGVGRQTSWGKGEIAVEAL